MKLQVAAALSVCAVLALPSGLSAQTHELSDSQLDSITAGAESLLGGGNSFSRLDGPLQPAPPPAPPSPPSPPAPPSPNQIVISEGGVTLSVIVPSNPGGPEPTVAGGIQVTPTGAIGLLQTRVTNDSGGPVNTGGIRASVFSGG